MNNTTTSKAALLVVVALLGLVTSLQAQSFDSKMEPAAITSFGGDASCGSGSISYSGGEVAVRYSIARAITVVNITRSFSEGVQQPYTTRDYERYEGIDPLTVSMAVYPNPTTDRVVIACSQVTEPLDFTLYNANGQSMAHGTYSQGEVQIDMENMPAGNYMLKVANSNKTNMNIYKIIKAK